MKIQDILNKSLEFFGDKLQLKNDEETPGNSKYYGTNEIGAKGFHSLPPVDGGDADTLEGNSASAFALSDHNHNLNDLAEKSYNNLTDKPDLTLKVDKTNVLEKDNTTEFIPSGDYNPSTKKYVDDSIPDISNKADKSNVLEKDNATEFVPDSDYEPATKKYVDDFAVSLNNPINPFYAGLETSLKDMVDAINERAIYVSPASIAISTMTFDNYNDFTLEEDSVTTDLGHGVKTFTTEALKVISNASNEARVSLKVRVSNFDQIVILYTALNVETGHEPIILLESTEGEQILLPISSDTTNGVYASAMVPVAINPGSNYWLTIRLPANSSGTSVNLIGAIVPTVDLTYTDIASGVKVIDTDSNFTSTDLEGVLKELSDRITALEP